MFEVVLKAIEEGFFLLSIEVFFVVFLSYFEGNL